MEQHYMNVRDTVVFGPEILSIILSFVAPKQVLVLQRVCSTWKGIIEDTLEFGLKSIAPSRGLPPLPESPYVFTL